MPTKQTSQPSRPAGPLFIVGLSRSGTKLLRDLLNQHPQIQIPIRESYFIPKVLTQFAADGKLPDKASRKAFEAYFPETSFCHKMSDLGHPLAGEVLHEIVNKQTWSEIIEAIFRHYTGTVGKPIIWGDKTPKYLNYMLLLKAHFPDARFLHIVRDPRDCVLSAQGAWGANIYVSAQQWLEGMQGATDQSRKLGRSYHRLSYERLVTDPAQTLADACAFLELPYLPEMTRLDAPVERRGDLNHATRQNTAIAADNICKFRTGMSTQKLQHVEQIVFPFAAEMGYLPEAGMQKHKPLEGLTRLAYSVPHYYGSLRLLVKRWGMFRGIRYAMARRRL